MSDRDYETLTETDNIFYQKHKHLINEYRIISSCSLKKGTTTNIINIVKNNQLFELIAKLNTEHILEYNNKNGIIKYVISSKAMKELGDKFALKFTNDINIISDNHCIVSGASVNYSNSKYSNIIHLNSLKITFNIINNSFNAVILYNMDDTKFNRLEIFFISKVLTEIINKLNLYVCN